MSRAQGKLSRRTLFAGAGTAGAVAAVVSLVPAAKSVEPTAQEPKPAPAKGGGYHLSEHVKRYFKTTQI